MKPLGTLLVVDDDQDVQDVLTDALGRRYLVVVALDGRAALLQLMHENPDLVLLDLRMPDMDGVLLITSIRKVSRTPIIVLSARREQADVVTCLRSGADDFIAKPFDLDDLEARIEAVLRRARRDPKVPPETWEYDGLSVSNARGVAIRGQPIHFAPVEFKMLRALAQHPAELVTRRSLALDVWGYEGDDSRSTRHMIDVHMGRLRRRLEHIEGAPQIRTVRREGFRLQKASEVE